MWIKENTPLLLVKVQTFTDTIKIDMLASQKVGKMIDLKTQLYHSWASLQRMLNHTAKDNCSTKFISALFIIAKNWKQTRCPST